MIKQLLKDFKYSWEYKDYVDLVVIGLMLILSPILIIAIANVVCVRYLIYKITGIIIFKGGS
jgi:uncharacterized membrane protein YesL